LLSYSSTASARCKERL